MAFNITASLQNVQSKLSAGGYFAGGVLIGEPKSPPGTRFTAAIFMNSVNVPRTVLNALEEVHVVNIRVYDNMLHSPAEDIEIEMSVVLSDLLNDLASDFDLGGTVRAIDFAGMYGSGLSVKWGYVDVGGTMYRIADVNLPLILVAGATVTA